ncbi:hypothetical protein HHK36_012095 [Tetracentron sinense]|uniref:Uncharacterized protein n=1 Tax=Tetracentron sinense TaxID=13715 RepID=A0A834ZC08_TETSI|nr:hypothetical protein HHK36_012095 [Tetracentron sinense]
MRYLFCKLHCPSFICFCICDDTLKKEKLDGKQEAESIPKSSLKKPSSEPIAPKEVEMRRVKWMDFLGKELIEMKEFEPSESEDSNGEGEGKKGGIRVIQ